MNSRTSFLIRAPQLLDDPTNRARLSPDDGDLTRKLITAIERETKMLAIERGERETLLRALENCPDDLAEFSRDAVARSGVDATGRARLTDLRHV
jgi:hypothetical protein